MGCCHCQSEEPCAGQIGIFRHLDQESQQKISDLAIHRQVKKGEILCSPEKTVGLYLISEGKVKVYELSADGREKLIRVLGKGDFVGEETLFSSTETHTFSEALTDLQVCHIRREDFLNLLMDYPSISLKLLEEMNHRVMQLSHRIASDASGSVTSRLAGYLLELSSAQDSTEITLPLQMKELAAFLDTTPETLSRRMKTLQSEGILQKKTKTGGYHLVIRNIERLSQIAESDCM